MILELLKHGGNIIGYNLLPENPAEEKALKLISDGLDKAEKHPEDEFGFYYAGITDDNKIKYIHRGYEEYDIKTLKKIGEIKVLDASEEKDEFLVCSKCGSKNVQVTAWVDANTNRYAGENDGDVWCEDCDEHTTLNLIKPDEKKGQANA